MSSVLHVCGFACAALALISGVAYAAAPQAKALITVDPTGAADFKSVQSAIDSAIANGGAASIQIKAGRYWEKIRIAKSAPPIALLGDSNGETVLTYDDTAGSRDEDGNRIGTFLSASTTIESDDFSARRITFENAAGKGKGQALAISVIGDRATFETCQFLGWQDTVYLEAHRHYFENCEISGSVDFIFGGATAYFNRCTIHLRAGGYICAPSTPEQSPFGFVFDHCNVVCGAEPFKTSLARPWRPFGSALYLSCNLPEQVDPVGWNNWADPTREKTARFSEFDSRGPGASSGKRAAWARPLTAEQAAAITPAAVLAGNDQWNPLTHERTLPITQSATQTAQNDETFLFTSFRGNGEDGLHLAYSTDAYHWTDLGRSFLAPSVGNKLMRDPSLCQTPDGTFHLVWTTGWDDRGFGYAHSKDLIHWSDQQFIDVMKDEPTTLNVWAPEIRYEESRRLFVVYWSSTIPGRFPGDDDHPRHRNHRMYQTTTADFTSFPKPKLFYDPGYSSIDGIVVDRRDSRFVLIVKDERVSQRRLRVAFGTVLFGPYDNVSEPFTPEGAEGPTVLALADKWIVYFDLYMAHRYGAMETHDFKHWIDITDQMSFPTGQRHGSVLRVPTTIVNQLKEH